MGWVEIEHRSRLGWQVPMLCVGSRLCGTDAGTAVVRRSKDA